MVRKDGRYTPCHSTSSVEYSHPILAATVNSVSMSAGSSAYNRGLPGHLRELENVQYGGGVPWMLMPDDEGVYHIVNSNEIPPPETKNPNVRLELYTR